MAELTMKADLMPLRRFLDSLLELTSKHSTEHVDIQKEARRGCAFPLRVILRQSAGRNDTMNMGMVEQVLTPRMQHTEKTICAPRWSGLAATSSIVSALMRRSNS